LSIPEASALLPVAAGHLPTIVTYLEMRNAPPPRPLARSVLRMERWAAPVDPQRYLRLFRSIGDPWLWHGRLGMTDAELSRILDAPTTHVHVATRRDGIAVGLVEIDFATTAEAEIVYFGLAPEMTGHGNGGWLMAHALRLAWAPGIGRVWLHTCDLDHPAALGFYRRQGFTPYTRAIEICPDPRLNGLYPRDASGHVPLL
jgi:GNAT superfamily N-acetyltransferase